MFVVCFVTDSHIFYVSISTAGSLDMRLLGDPTKGAIIEVSDGMVSGSLCPATWTINIARSICNHFGYASALAATKIASHNSANSRNIIRFSQNCQPDTYTLDDIFLDCNSMMTKQCDCSDNTLHAGIVCSRGNVLIIISNTANFTMIYLRA